MNLRVWWIRNVPNKPIYVPVETIKEAIDIINRLAKQDLKDPNIFSNVGGLEYYDEKEKEWYDYHDEEDRDIMEIIDERDKLIKSNGGL